MGEHPLDVEKRRAAVAFDIRGRQFHRGHKADHQPQRWVGAVEGRDGRLGLDEATYGHFEKRRRPLQAVVALIPVAVELDRDLAAVRHL